MSDTRERFKKLLRLATHEGTPVEEARTAALLALQLVKRQGWALTVREPAAASPPSPSVAEQWANAAVYAAYEATVNADYYRARAAARATPPTGGWGKRRGKFARASVSGQCATCGERYESGFDVWYDPATGQTWHADCRDPAPT